jgi:VCBS repeat-containing protein
MINNLPTLGNPVLSSGTEDQSYIVAASQLLATANDSDGDTLNITSMSMDHGTVFDNQDGTFTLTPNSNFNGTAQLTYIVSDGTGTVSNTISFTLDMVNDAPLALDSYEYTVEDNSLLYGSVSASDVDGDNLTYSLTTTAPSGLLFNPDGTYSFDPSNQDYQGLSVGETQHITFSYQADDGSGGIDTANVIITLTGTNDTPIVSGETSYEMNSNGSLLLTENDLLNYLSDIDGDNLSIQNFDIENGVITDNGDQTWTFSPAPDWGGTLSLSYQVSDGTVRVPTTADIAVIGEGVPLNISQTTEVLVNSFTTNEQTNPSITSLNGGGYVVSWASAGQDGSSLGVYAQRFDENGVKQGTEFQVNTYSGSDQTTPSISGLSDGGFVIAWHSMQDTNGFGVYAQRYNSHGNPIGNEFQVNTYTSSYQINADVVGLSDGGFVITWQSHEQDSSGYGIYAQRYDSNGATIGSEFLIPTSTAGDQTDPSITALNNGGFVVAWEGIDEVYTQIYDANGQTVGNGAQQVNITTTNAQDKPSVAALAGGGYVVAWQSNGQDGAGLGSYARRYDALGKALDATEIQINQETLSAQGAPSIVGLEDGGYFVTWHSWLQDTNGKGIYGRRFGVDGQPMGDEFLINDHIVGHQDYPDITVMSNGNLALTWQSHGQDGSGSGIYSKIIEFSIDNRALTGTVGADALTGGSGHDVINANNGDDFLNGEEGDDILNGGSGNDNLTGGYGADTFLFSSEEDATSALSNLDKISTLGTDSITDFVSGLDRLELSQTDFGFNLGALVNGETYFETDTLSNLSAETGPAIVIVGHPDGNAGVEVWYTEDAANMDTSNHSQNSYQISYIEGTNTSNLSEADFIVK